MDVDWAADIDLWMRILGNNKIGIFVNRFWSFRQHHESQRDVESRERFGIEAKKSVDLWMKSENFPPELDKIRDKIHAFALLREIYYYYHSKNIDDTKKLLTSAIYSFPEIYFIGPCKDYCAELGIYNTKINKLIFLTNIKIKIRNVNLFNRKPERKDDIQNIIDINFASLSNEEASWYQK